MPVFFLLGTLVSPFWLFECIVQSITLVYPIKSETSEKFEVDLFFVQRGRSKSDAFAYLLFQLIMINASKVL